MATDLMVGDTVEITHSLRDFFGGPLDLLYKKGTRGVIEKITDFDVLVKTSDGVLLAVMPGHLKKLEK